MTKKTWALLIVLILVASGILYLRQQAKNVGSSTSQPSNTTSQKNATAMPSPAGETFNFTGYDLCTTDLDCIPVSQPDQKDDGTPIEVVGCYNERILTDCKNCKKDEETIANPNLASCACIASKCELQVR